jgi:hypothetical protein
MRIRNVRSPLVLMLGWCGLVLIVLLGWACGQLATAPHTVRTRVRRGLARLVIASVTAVGWTVDHLAPMSARATRPVQSTQPIREHQ